MSSGTHDLKLWSLRGRLIKLFAAGGFSAWIFTASLILVIARREDTEDRDLALRRSGMIVMKLALHEVEEEEQGDFPAIQNAIVPNLPDLIIQVRDRDGRLLLNTPGRPDAPLSSTSANFDDVQLSDGAWRVADLRDEASGLQVQIAENEGRRQKDFMQLSLALLVPLILGLPLVMVVAWFLATRALRPLRRAAQALLDRQSADLSAIHPGELPQEALPLVAAFNGLLLKLGESWDEERRFAASVAHELRTPLAGIRLNLQRMQKTSEETSTQDSVTILLGAVDRATRVIEQLLTLAGLERNLAREQEPEPIDVRRTIDETLAEFSVRAGNRGIEFEVETNAEVLPIPAQAFYLVLRNFVENAIRHSPDDATIGIGAGDGNGQWWLAVEDAGTGIVVQSAADATRSTESFQIGLSLVRKIAALLGGRLESGRSATLGGASFRFSAPMQRPPPAVSSFT